jgi:predicted nucleotidyltransferase
VKSIPSDILDEIVARLVAEFAPESIILFGSHAWGTPTDDSDVDLLVIVSASDERPARRAVRAHRCLRGIPIHMDVLVKTRAEVDDLVGVPASIDAEILERGKVLYERSQAGDRARLAREGVA